MNVFLTYSPRLSFICVLTPREWGSEGVGVVYTIRDIKISVIYLEIVGETGRAWQETSETDDRKKSKRCLR